MPQMKELKELTLLVSDEEEKRQMRRALFSLSFRICRFYFMAQVSYPSFVNEA